MKENKILISFEEESATKKMRQITGARSSLSKIYKALTDVIGEPVSKKEFLSIFDEGLSTARINDSSVRDLFISKKVPEGMIGGVSVNIGMISTPDTTVMKSAHLSVLDKALLANDYLLIESGDIVMAKDVEVRVADEFKIYAETPEEIKRYKLAEKLASAWNNIAETLPESSYFTERLRPEEIRTVVDSEDHGIFKPSPYYVKYGSVSLQYQGLAPSGALATVERPVLDGDYIDRLMSNAVEGTPEPDYQPEPTPDYLPDHLG